MKKKLTVFIGKLSFQIILELFKRMEEFCKKKEGGRFDSKKEENTSEKEVNEQPKF